MKYFIRKRLIIVLFFFSFASSLFAQNNISFKQIDLKSYNFYQLQQWDSLVQLAQIAKKNKYSSYALDFRFGAAFYHNKKYRKSLGYFENLDLKQSHDLLLYEYRYYAYIFSNRLADARRLTLDYKNLNHRVNFSNSLAFGEVGAESKLFDFRYKRTEENYTSINQQITQSRIYSGFFLNFHTLKNLELTFAPMWLNENILYLNSTLEDEKWEENIFQNHLYFSGKYFLDYGKALWVNYHHTASEIDSHPLESENDIGQLSNTQDHLFGLFYQQDIKNLKFTLGANYSPKDTILEFLPSLSLTYYPFGNDVLYSVSRLAYQNTPSYMKLTPLVVKQTIGVKLGKKVWIEGVGQWGKINKFYDDNGYIIYSQDEMIKTFWGLNAKYLVHKNWEIFASFVQYNATSSYEKNDQNRKENFSVNSGLIGLKWKFYKN